MRLYRLERFVGAICGAGPLLKDTALRFEDRFGFPIHHGYGLGNHLLFLLSAHRSHPAQHRHWLADYEFRRWGGTRHNVMAIPDDQGRPTPEGMRGDLHPRAHCVCWLFPARTPTRQHFSGAGSAREMKVCIEQTKRADRSSSSRTIERTHHPRRGQHLPLEIDDVLKAHRGGSSPWRSPLRTATTAKKSRPTSSRTLGKTPSPKRDLLAHCRTRLPLPSNPKLSCSAMRSPYVHRETQTAGVEGC